MEGGLDYMEKLINTIIESVKEKKVQSYGKKILKKCSFKSKNDLSNIVIFATWLYIYGYNEYAMQVCDLLSDVSFNGNYDLWNNADYSMRISRNRYLNLKQLSHSGYEDYNNTTGKTIHTFKVGTYWSASFHW